MDTGKGASGISFGVQWPGWRWWFARLGLWVVRRGPRFPVTTGLYAWWLWRHGEADRV